jgi:hypothetical protein
MKILNLDYLKKYVSDNRKIIIFSFLIAIICYGYEIFNFSLSIDEELASFNNASNNRFLIEIGRWGTYLLNRLMFSQSLLPYAPFLFGVLCLAAASVIFVTSIGGSPGAKYIFSIVFITSPVHAYYLAFNTADPYFSIGLALMVISYLEAVKGFETKSRFALLRSVLTCAFSISIYQALFSVFVTLMMFHLLTKKAGDPNFNCKALLKRATGFILLAVVSLALYKMTDFLIFKMVLDSKASHGMAYLNSLQSWGKLPSMLIIKNLILGTITYFTGKLIPGERYLIPFSVFFLISYLVYKFGTQKRTVIDRIILILLLLLLLVSPFILIYINGAMLPVRTMMAFPLLLAMLWWLVYTQIRQSGKKIMLVLAFVLFITNTGITTRLFYSSWVAWQADRDMANRIYERICNLDLPDNGKPIEVAFLGKYDHPGNALFIKSDIFGASFFGWDNGNPIRILFLFKTMGINNLRMASNMKTKVSLSDTVQKLPCWPFKGSVCFYENVVIVKLSNEPK